MKIPFTKTSDNPDDDCFPFENFNEVLFITTLLNIAQKGNLNQEQTKRFLGVYSIDNLSIIAYDLMFGLTAKGPRLKNSLNPYYCAI